MTERDETPVPARPRDRSFGPTVLVGLVGAGLTAVGAARVWATSRGDAAGVPVEESVTGAEAQPLVAALAFVALAAWGVVLVSRGRVRRAVSTVGLLAAAGSLLAVVLAFGSAQDAAVDAAVTRGATGDALVGVLGAWYYLTGLGALLAATAFGVAVVRSPHWPAMGERYDAPGARSAPTGEDDMWRALDEGRDPTS